MKLGTISLMAAVCAMQSPVWADSFSERVFATGAAVGGSAPDSVTLGGNALWVEYGNGASSSGGAGNSTIVQYSLSGAVLHTYSIAGSVDGLKYNPNTGQVWALQNQDANSALTIINPSNGQLTSYTYGSFYSASATRGFDDVAFTGGKIFLSETNPAAPSDPVIVQLTGSLSSPIQASTVQTLSGLLATDADSLKSTPSGGLILSGEADNALNFITNPGLANQSATSVALVTAAGAAAGSPDDTIIPTATAGTFYVADTAANVVYAITGSGLTVGSLYGNVGGSFDGIDPTTGLVTTKVTGSSFHGMDFDPAPEPATWGAVLTGLLLCGSLVSRKKISRGRGEYLDMRK